MLARGIPSESINRLILGKYPHLPSQVAHLGNPWKSWVAVAPRCTVVGAAVGGCAGVRRRGGRRARLVQREGGPGVTVERHLNPAAHDAVPIRRARARVPVNRDGVKRRVEEGVKRRV